MRILGIETSCDDTGIAIYDSNLGVIVNDIHSQNQLHSHYGGVVPELAARGHTQNIIPLIKQLLKKSQCHINSIDAISYTAGPGLIGSLLIGATVGKTLSLSWNIPTISVNHMEAHLLSPMLENKNISFPFIGLLVSGGHTQLIQAYEFGHYQILGDTMDDSAGDAFDKTAKLLNLQYPGGKLLSNLAKYGTPGRFTFPRPMLYSKDLNFSFSGLKTHVANIINNEKKDFQTCADIAYEFESAVIDILIIKCQRALRQTGFKRLIIAGGVSANSLLRREIKHMTIKENCEIFYAPLEYCTDNGAMVAYVGMLRFYERKYSPLNIFVHRKWSLSDLKKYNACI